MWSVVGLLNRNLVGIMDSEESMKDIVSVKVVDRWTGNEWRVVSVYCSPSEAVEVIIGRWNGCCLEVGGRSTRSRLWFCEESGGRGQGLERLILAN